jgi:hypothetical protein
MKKLILLLILLTCALTYKLKAQQPVDRAVRCEVEILSNTSLKLQWLENQYATGYQINRRMKGDLSWGTVVKSLAASATSYTDTDIEAGKSYEYKIYRQGSGGFAGYGYVLTGIDVDPVQFGKRVLLIVEKELADSIVSELDMLQTDLALSGWNVEYMSMDKTKDVPTVKVAIDELHKAKPIDAIYILGHVAVPYSGTYCLDPQFRVPPDGHAEGSGNHCGAWPADVYYGVIDGFWTDVNLITAGTRSHTANRVGDGKFDQIIIPKEVTISVGRVDFSNMPAFPMSEVALTKQYIQKIHDYKLNLSTGYPKGIVDDNFKSFAESFSSTGWRNFTSMFGRDQVVEKDFFTTMKDSIFMFSMLDGAGSFTSCNGIGTTTDYVNNDVSAMFNFTFGSFFGDWDVKNNLLRAALATKSGGLTNAWSGRPWWHAHAMALGEDIGYCTKITQNNKNTNYYGSAFVNNIHIALMGDPTLRLYAYEAPTMVVVNAAADRKSAAISWTASTDNTVSGYDIYVSTAKYGYYEKMNTSPISGTSFNQAAAYQGTNFYMVRARKSETTPSGRFTNYSHGALGSAADMVGETRSIDAVVKTVFTVYPNPSTGFVQIQSIDNRHLNRVVSVIGMDGRIVLQTTLTSSKTIDLSNQPKGIYQIRIGNSYRRLVLQ